MTKKRYISTASATSFHGSQTYYVDAESETAAFAAVEAGAGVFMSEELEVQDLSPFELESVEGIPE